jgi:hypothetical protein
MVRIQIGVYKLGSELAIKNIEKSEKMNRVMVLVLNFVNVGLLLYLQYPPTSEAPVRMDSRVIVGLYSCSSSSWSNGSSGRRSRLYFIPFNRSLSVRGGN